MAETPSLQAEPAGGVGHGSAAIRVLRGVTSDIDASSLRGYLQSCVRTYVRTRVGRRAVDIVSIVVNSIVNASTVNISTDDASKVDARPEGGT